MSVKSGINNSKAVMLGLLTIGLIGLLFLIVYGNLSGNLGFASDTGAITNERINLTLAGNTPTSLTGVINPVLANIVLRNATSGQVILATNYTETAGLFASTVGGNFTNDFVNVTATYTADSTGEQQSEQVIGNLTGGVVSFFSFSNVWFILAAVALLIAIVIGIIFLVMKLGGNNKFSS